MPTRSNLSVGIFVDVANMTLNGGRGMKYNVLREFACRGGAEPVRMNCYVGNDLDRCKSDATFCKKQTQFFDSLRDYGYKVITKVVKRYRDEDTGDIYTKANADLDLAVDMLLQSRNLDRILLCSGDGDFVQVVRALQNQGCRVEVLAFNNVSSELRREADLFVSGYLIPNLLEIRGSSKWGEIGSQVRGVCYSHRTNYGYLRYLKSPDGDLTVFFDASSTSESPYESIHFYDDELPKGFNTSELPSRKLVFSFKIVQREAKGKILTSAGQLELVARLSDL